MGKNTNIIVELSKLNFSYDKATKFCLKDITLNFEHSKIYAILGQNGSGKTTLLSCIDGINKNYSGNIFIYDNNKKLEIKKLKDNKRAKLISYISQNNTQNNLSVYDNIMLGRKPHLKISPMLVDHEITSQAINIFKLNHISHKSSYTLSGGEFQKVCIARAFAQHTPVVLMDEPTNNLDVYNQHEIFGIFKNKVQKENLCVICIIHDINIAMKYADTLIFMKNGKVIKTGDKNIVDNILLKEIYGVNSHIFEEGKQKYIVI